MAPTWVVLPLASSLPSIDDTIRHEARRAPITYERVIQSETFPARKVGGAGGGARGQPPVHPILQVDALEPGSIGD